MRSRAPQVLFGREILRTEDCFLKRRQYHLFSRGISPRLPPNPRTLGRKCAGTVLFAVERLDGQVGCVCTRQEDAPCLNARTEGTSTWCVPAEKWPGPDASRASKNPSG